MALGRVLASIGRPLSKAQVKRDKKLAQYAVTGG